MSYKRLETVDALAREDLNLKVTCEHCGHAAVLDTIELKAKLYSRRLPSRLSHLEDHLRCSACRLQKVIIWPTDAEPTSI